MLMVVIVIATCVNAYGDSGSDFVSGTGGGGGGVVALRITPPSGGSSRGGT